MNPMANIMLSSMGTTHLTATERWERDLARREVDKRVATASSMLSLAKVPQGRARKIINESKVIAGSNNDHFWRLVESAIEQEKSGREFTTYVGTVQYTVWGVRDGELRSFEADNLMEADKQAVSLRFKGYADISYAPTPGDNDWPAKEAVLRSYDHRRLTVLRWEQNRDADNWLC